MKEPAIVRTTSPAEGSVAGPDSSIDGPPISGQPVLITASAKTMALPTEIREPGMRTERSGRRTRFMTAAIIHRGGEVKRRGILRWLPQCNGSSVVARLSSSRRSIAGNGGSQPGQRLHRRQNQTSRGSPQPSQALSGRAASRDRPCSRRTERNPASRPHRYR